MNTYLPSTRLNDAFFGLTVCAFASAVIVTSAVSLYERVTTAVINEYKADPATTTHETRARVVATREQPTGATTTIHTLPISGLPLGDYFSRVSGSTTTGGEPLSSLRLLPPATTDAVSGVWGNGRSWLGSLIALGD